MSQLKCVAVFGFVLLVLAALAQGAPTINATLPSNFSKLQPEVQQRQDLNYTGFVFDLGQEGPAAPNSNVTADVITSNPFLASLPGDGNGEVLVELGPCAGNTVHIHPRGSEISTLLYGNLTFGFVDEDLNFSNQLVLRNLSQLQTIHIPQGLLHFSFNDNCKPAAFLASFATSDPGTQTIWDSLMQIPNSILHLSTGIPEADFNVYKQLPLIASPGTGGEACLRRCGLSFKQTNQPLPNSLNPTGDWNKIGPAAASGPSATVDLLGPSYAAGANPPASPSGGASTGRRML